MPDFKATVGNVEIISLSDGGAEFPAANVFPKVTAEEWKRHPGVLSTDGKIKTNFGCFALHSRGKTILIDTGVGPGRQGRLLEDLKAKGIKLDEIDIVATTHLHGDHVGWNITSQGGKPHLTFPKAKYSVPKKDWDHFSQPEILGKSEHVKNMVVPLKALGALNLMDGPTNLTDEVTMVPTPGHTPGHMSAHIFSQGQSGFIMGDVTNFPFQAQETAWAPSFDFDPDMARKTRGVVLERILRENALVGAGHFLPPSLGHFVLTEGRRYWKVLGS